MKVVMTFNLHDKLREGYTTQELAQILNEHVEDGVNEFMQEQYEPLYDMQVPVISDAHCMIEVVEKIDE